MKKYAVNNRIKPAELNRVKIGGYPGELMDAFFRERVTSDFAREVVLGETHAAFVNATDGDQPIGLWQGEFWGKWVISAARVCRYLGDDELKSTIHTAALELIGLQKESGYLGTYKNSKNFYPPNVNGCEWNWNIWCRKYTLWGLLECYLLTDDEQILASSVRLADNLLSEIEEEGCRLGQTGSFKGLPSCSILKPMLILYRITEDERYLDFCLKFVKEWENPEWMSGIIANSLAERPLGEWYDLDLKWAKAYEMMSCFDGLLELYRVTGDLKYLAATECFFDLIMKHESNPLYSVAFNDEFRNAAYNINGITEPCDVIHLMRLCHELFALTGEAKYMDTFELAFLNPFLAGSFKDGKWGARAVRSHGRHLAVIGQANMKHSHCCVNNMPRGYLNMAESCLMTDGAELYINTYTPFSASVNMASGSAAVTASGEYIPEGRVKLTVDFEGAITPVKLRIPAWAENVTVAMEGREYRPECGFLTVIPTAQHTEIDLLFDSPVKIIPMKGTPLAECDPWQVRRFAEGTLPREMFLTEDRCILHKGPIILCRSKLIGSTEEEMFGGATIDPESLVTCERAPARDGISTELLLTFTSRGEKKEIRVCDFASGSNIMTEDNHTFSVWF